MNAFDQAATRDFEKELIELLSESFSNHFDELGSEKIRAVVQLGILQARLHDLSSRKDIHRYVVLMLCLGSYFESDPQLLWIATAFQESRLSPSERLQLLSERARLFLFRVAGRDEKNLQFALKRFKETFVSLDHSSNARLSRNEVLELMRTIYPEKCEFVGEKQLHILMDRVSQTNLALYGDNPMGDGTDVLLMFMFGHRFADDPQYPWAVTTNKDRDLNCEQRRMMLRKSAVSLIDNWLE